MFGNTLIPNSEPVYFNKLFSIFRQINNDKMINLNINEGEKTAELKRHDCLKYTCLDTSMKSNDIYALGQCSVDISWMSEEQLVLNDDVQT